MITTRKRGRPPVPKEVRGTLKTLCLPPDCWEYISTFDGATVTQRCVNMIDYLKRFAPLGQDAGRERDDKGRWKKGTSK